MKEATVLPSLALADLILRPLHVFPNFDNLFAMPDVIGHALLVVLGVVGRRVISFLT